MTGTRSGSAAKAAHRSSTQWDRRARGLRLVVEAVVVGHGERPGVWLRQALIAVPTAEGEADTGPAIGDAAIGLLEVLLRSRQMLPSGLCI